MPSLTEDTLKRAIVLAGSIVALALAPAWAAPADGLEGTWEGFLNPSPVAEVRLILRVEKGEGGALKAKAESPGVKALGSTVFDDISLKDGEAVLVAKASGREFRGKINPSGTEIVGEWIKGTAKLPLTFARVEGAVTPAEVWEGPLELPGGIKLRLAFHALKTRAGAFRSTMDSPDQGTFGLKVDSTEIDKESIRFAVKAIGGEYEGKLGPAGDSAEGRWKQGGASFPLTLKKVAEATEVRRPQLPKGPFPYVSEEVAYDSRAAGRPDRRDADPARRGTARSRRPC